MKSQKFVVNKASNGQGIKALHEELIDLLIVLVDAFCAEIKELSHLAALMVPSQHVNRLWEIQLQRVQ